MRSLNGQGMCLWHRKWGWLVRVSHQLPVFRSRQTWGGVCLHPLHPRPNTAFNIKQGQWEFSVWCRELKSGALGQTRGMGWGGRWKGGSKGIRLLNLIHVDGRKKPTQYYKVITFQLNKFLKILKKKQTRAKKFFMKPTTSFFFPPLRKLAEEKYSITKFNRRLNSYIIPGFW